MKSDLLFYIVSARKWPSLISAGKFVPDELKEKNYIHLFKAGEVNEILNSKFSGRKNLFLIIIDISRMEKRPKEVDGEVRFEDAIPVDAVLDKIRISCEKDGSFDVDIVLD
ncbi:DUF952 domain-containing protein [Rhodohalobacter halophilus]|uniref:DUF952 domain-containing protein n=1 Tax=Rhodohalobacter halophilus TaxID=1812810 RepID=UPI00083F565F|nr:DUF952 domain-containing protein [Rhodohalobacter halophilus]